MTHEVEPRSSGKLHTVCGLCGNVCAEQNIYCITIKPALVPSAQGALWHTRNLHGSLLFQSLVVTVTYTWTPCPACQRSCQRAEERSTLQSWHLSRKFHHHRGEGVRVSVMGVLWGFEHDITHLELSFPRYQDIPSPWMSLAAHTWQPRDYQHSLHQTLSLSHQFSVSTSEIKFCQQASQQGTWGFFLHRNVALISW